MIFISDVKDISFYVEITLYRYQKTVSKYRKVSKRKNI